MSGLAVMDNLQHQSQALDNFTREQLYGWMDIYCSRKPSRHVVAGAIELFPLLRARSVAKASPLPRKPPAGEESAVAYLGRAMGMHATLLVQAEVMDVVSSCREPIAERPDASERYVQSMLVRLAPAVRPEFESVMLVETPARMAKSASVAVIRKQVGIIERAKGAGEQTCAFIRDRMNQDLRMSLLQSNDAWDRLQREYPEFVLKAR